MSESSLRGQRVLTVEDDAMVAFMLEDMLTRLGCEVVGPAGSLDDALRLAEAAEADIAILDVCLKGRNVYPVAERLEARGIPLIFATGYAAEGLPDRWRSSPILGKPFLEPDLEAALKAALGR